MTRAATRKGARDGATGGHLANPVAKKLFWMLNGWQSSPVTLGPCEVTEGIMTTTEIVGNRKEASQEGPDAYLSRVPLRRPIRPGPLVAACWRSERWPLSQGIRTGNSINVPAHDHILKSRTEMIWTSVSAGSAPMSSFSCASSALGGRDDEVIMAEASRRAHVTITMHKLMRPRKNPWALQAKRRDLSLLTVCDRPAILADFLPCTVEARMQMPSQSSHGCAALLTTRLPTTSSDKICPTRAVRHGFSTSSVGNRIARTACTSSCR
jgi:hypothetical protein